MQSVLEGAWRGSVAVIDLLPIAVWITDLDGVALRANRSAALLCAGASGDAGSSAVPPPQAPPTSPGARPRYRQLDGTEFGAADEPLATLAGTGKAVRDLDVLLERRDGTRIAVVLDLEPVHDGDGRLSGALHCVRLSRASERAHAHDNSNRADRPDRMGERQRALIAATHSIVFTTGADGAFVEPQPAWEAYTGQTWPACAGWGWAQMMHPDDRAGIEAAWSQALSARTRHEWRGRAWHAATGAWRAFACRAAPVFDRDGTLREWIGTHTDVEEETRAEERISDSEARHRAIFELAVHGLLTIDEHGTIESINRAGERLFGHAREEIVGRNVELLMPSRANTRTSVAPLAHGEAPAGQAREIRGLRKDGTRFDLELVESELVLAGRKRVHCFVQDVSERKRAERAVRESEARLRELADAMPQIVWTARADGHVDYYNRRWYEYTGLTCEQSTQPEGWRAVLHADDVAPTIERWYAAVESGEAYAIEHRYRHAATGDFRWHLARALPVRDENGKIVRWFGTSTDIDEQKLTEHRLRASEQQYRLMGEAIPCGVWMANPLGAAAYVSPSFLGLIGMTLEEVREHGLARRLPPQDVAPSLARWQHCIATGENWEAEHRLLGADGKYHVVLSRGHAIRDADGRITSWVGIHLDISDRKHLELELEEAKNAAERASLAKDHFLAVLSHELRTPLTPVLMIATALENRRDLPQGVLDELGILRRNVELEARLIDDLLDLTRITRGKLELNLNAVDLGVLLQETVRICSAELDAKTMHLALAVEPGLLPIEADAARLQQTFWNLIKNAIKFTPSGGHVTIRAREDVACAGVLIEVEDDGIGIEPEALARIFDAFEQGDPAVTKTFGGLGLGLAISKALVEFHGGTIRALSAGRGCGSRFTVTLPARPLAVPGIEARRDPRTRAAPKMPSTAARKDAGQRRGLSILCVEDHADTARLMGQLLHTRGHTVRIAGSFSAALSAFEKERFDLLLSDLGLPDGSGLDLMRRLRAEQPGLVGIALTGYGTEDDVRACLDAGFAQHLTKPINMRELEGAIVRLTSRAE